MGTYKPLDASKLTRDKKRDALKSLLFITEKRDGRVKSKKCAIASKQRTYDGYDKCAGSFPTVTTKGLIMTCAIDAHQEQDNAIVDVGHAFLHADNDKNILVKLRGKIVELPVQLEPVMYRKYVTTGPNGEPILYVRLLKALYGLLRSALLFYKKLRADLENMGSEVNPYDPCVANNVINWLQMTVTWHVNDVKISHKESDDITNFITELGKLYDNDLAVHQGKVHSYLGMLFYYSTKGTVKISMLTLRK